MLDQLGLGWSGRRSRAIQIALRAYFYIGRRVARDPVPRLVPPGTEKTLVIMEDRKAARYARFRQTNIDLCASVFDVVLAVSERSRKVLIDRGVPAGKIAVSYIGTAHAKVFAHAQRKRSVAPGLHIAYLGYMRAGKGFFFLDSLFSIPDHLARDISITIAAPFRGDEVVNRLKGVVHRFRNIILHRGYTHATLDKVLAGVNLGVVPVLWEDNLPQVAIEIVSRGIPILTSDRGGAQEIAGNPEFVFEAGSTRAFCAKVEEIATGRLPLARFWRHSSRIFSMDAHVDDLLSYYRGDVGPAALPACSDSRPHAEPLALHDYALEASRRSDA